MGELHVDVPATLQVVVTNCCREAASPWRYATAFFAAVGGALVMLACELSPPR